MNRVTALTLAILPLMLAAGSPEVIRMRVPSAKAAGAFPPGTALRVMGQAEFENLVRAAREGSEREAGRRERPRLLRARHEAKWDRGVLMGTSEILVEGTTHPPCRAVLSPWGPAIDARLMAMDALGVAPDLKLGVQVAGTEPAAITLRWEQAPRPGSDGRGFDLDLPALDASGLTLDLPSRFVPEVAGMLRQGPSVGSAGDRRSWRFDGAGGSLRLSLAAEDGDTPACWVSGTTWVDAGETPASWRAEWAVEPIAGGSRRLAAVLPPGLELIDVAGPAVASYRAEATADGTTAVSIRLVDSLAGPSSLTIRAQARMPAEGPWQIPSVKPINAAWTGGRTLMALDSSQAVMACRPQASRQVSPSTEELKAASRGGTVLAFEATSAGPTAEVTIAPREPVASADIRGLLLLGREAPRVKARITWRLDRGRLLNLAVDLAAGWSPDRVQVQRAEAATSWHVEPRPGGGSRLLIHASPGPVDPSEPIVLELSAVAMQVEGFGPLDLPRVAPPSTGGVRIADEVWLAKAEPGVSVSPVNARGLAWIDPLAALIGDLGRASLRPGSEAMKPVLAWRWTAGDGRGVVLRSAATSARDVETWTTASISPDRMVTDWYVVVNPSGPDMAGVVVALGEPSDAKMRWEVLGNSARDAEASPLAADVLASQAVPAGASAWRLLFPMPGRGVAVFHARSERPWTGEGRLSLISALIPEGSRSSVLINIDRGLRPSVEGHGTWALDPSSSSRRFAATVGVAGGGDLSRRSRLAIALGYGPGASPLLVRTEPLPAAVPGGVIEEARLATRTSGSGPSLHRLTLCVVPGADRSLEIALPAGASPHRVRIDGQTASPGRREGWILIPLPPPVVPRSSLDVTIDYLSPAPTGSITADRPAFSMPCLGFSWEIDAPERCEVEPVRLGSAGWGSADPAWGSPPRLPGAWVWPEKPGDDRRTDVLREFEARSRAFPFDGLGLGEWLRRVDACSPPVVVDRLALDAAGLGPRSPLAGARGGASRGVIDQFTSMGLKVEPINGAALITTAGGVDEASPQAIRDAISRGNDASDRLQSVARWRGEPSPAVALRSLPSTGESSRSFVANSWPKSGAVVRLVDSTSRKAGAAAVGLAMVLAGLVARNASPRKRAIGLAVVAGPAWASLWWGPVAARETAGAVAWAGLGVAAFWFGRSFPKATPPRRRPPMSSLVRRGGAGLAVILAPLAFLAAGDDTPATDPTIVAVFAYDPPLDPDRACEVSLRLDDFERLQALADTPRGPEEWGVMTIRAEHEARRRSARDVLVTSTYELHADAIAPAAWSFPIEGARELSASLDGRDVPIRIEPGAKAASVLIGPKGRHCLVVRGVMACSQAHGGDSLRWAVPPIPASRIVVEGIEPSDRVDVPGARGRVEQEAGRVAGLLGPVSEVEIRWRPAKEPSPPPARGEVESLSLWEIEPAGDRVRMRLTTQGDEGLSRLVLNLEPSVIVRSFLSRPGSDASARRGEGGTTWEASFVPPLEPGEAVCLEFWKPLADTKAPLRVMPKIEPLNLARCDATVGVRRPEDWVSRVAAGPGQEVLTDEAFVRRWGPLPPGTQTFAGAVSSRSWTGVSLAAGAGEDRPVVTPRVQIVLSPGRLDVRAEATWVEPSGRSREVEVLIPSDLRLTHVEADGLTDRSRPTDDRLRLRFDGPGPHAVRKAVIEGWVPVDNDPMAAGPAKGEAEVPWPSWLNMTAKPGDLQIQAPANVAFHLEMQPGVEPLPYRGGYRVPTRTAPGRLTWSVEPVGVQVLIQGHLTLLPDSAEWVASARYGIAWGPCPPVQLLIPSDWADGARIEILGRKVRPDVEKTARGTVWTFAPDPPAWGGLQVIVRATRPWPSKGPLKFPDLVPLRQKPGDRVDSYVAFADASGRPLIPEGSAGIRPVDASKWNNDELILPAGLNSSVFHVLQNDWTLQFQRLNGPRPVADSLDAAGVALAEVTCVTDVQGAILGRAIYHLQSRGAPFLPLILPKAAAPLAADVDGESAAPRRDRQGRILIPLPDRGAGLVTFLWRVEAVAPGDRPIPLPAVLQADVPTLLTVYTPGQARVQSDLTAVGGESIERVRLQYMAKEIGEQSSRFDRGSSQDRAALLGALIRFEMQARAAERATWLEDGSAPIPRSEIREVRRALDDVLMAAGLDAFARSARSRVGLTADDPLPTQPSTPDLPTPLRIRKLGTPHFFQGEQAAPGRPIHASWAAEAPLRPSLSETCARAIAGASPMLALGAMAWRVGRRPRRLFGAMTAILALVAAMAGGGPLIVLILAVGVAAGRLFFADRGRLGIDPRV